MALLVVGMFVGPIVAIFLAFKAYKEQDPILKKNIKRKAWWWFLGPFVLLVALISLWGLINVLFPALQK